jgi:hypothetical protein
MGGRTSSSRFDRAVSPVPSSCVVRNGTWLCQNGLGDVGPGSQGRGVVSGRDRSDQRLDPDNVHDPCQIVGQNR